MDVEHAVRALAPRLRAAARITVLTGAGVSAASGIPTFRGPGGLWRSHRPEELATPEAFARDPHLVWEWYDWRRERIAGASPNEAHRVLARWQARGGCCIVTQNVDDLHHRAGTADVVRLHGSIWELSCWRACDASGGRPWRDERVPLPSRPPQCPSCGGLARPAVVWFGEMLPAAAVERAVAAAACDVFLAVGTSAVVHPAAGLVHHAARQGAHTVEINPEPTGASSRVDLAIAAPAEEILPRLDAALNG